VLVGHNPGLQELALQLLEEGAEDRAVIDRVASGFPTAAALVFVVDAAGRPRYDGFHRPKDHGGGADG
jgi:phosphohistidine phosphatase